MRGIALIAMASYHFTWDLENFGYTDPGLTAFGWWKIYARCIASTFLFLVGVSLFLAHGRQIRWPGFWKRFAMVAAAALAISAVTYFVTPDSFIFFGILHEIALASLLGLAFLRLPALLTLRRGGARHRSAHSTCGPNSSTIRRCGGSACRRSTRAPTTMCRCSPGSAPCLSGIAAAKLAPAPACLRGWRRLRPAAGRKPLIFIGRHSLAFYLIHQPLLFGCVWLFSQIAPAPVETREVRLPESCQVSCEQQRDTEFCASYCVCMLDTLQSEATFDRLYNGDQTPEFKAHLGDLAGICTAKTDESPMTEGGQQ